MKKLFKAEGVKKTGVFNRNDGVFGDCSVCWSLCLRECLTWRMRVPGVPPEDSLTDTSEKGNTRDNLSTKNGDAQKLQVFMCSSLTGEENTGAYRS